MTADSYSAWTAVMDKCKIGSFTADIVSTMPSASVCLGISLTASNIQLINESIKCNPTGTLSQYGNELNFPFHIWAGNRRKGLRLSLT